MHDFKGKNVLVTGGAGFVGSHIVDHLIIAGASVTLVDNLTTGKENYISPQATFFFGCVSDFRFLKKVFCQKKIDYVIHLASKINTNVYQENLEEDISVSINSTINLCKLCVEHAVETLIFASSVAVYGNQSLLPVNEEVSEDPIYSYGISKLTAEKYLDYFQRYYGLKYQVLRYANVYGIRQPIFGEVGVIAIFCEKVNSKAPFIIFGDGNRTRDYVHVSDVVSFTVDSLFFRDSGVYNVGSGVATSVNEIMSIFKQSISFNPEIQFMPFREGELESFALDVTKAKATGWTPKVALESGIKHTISNGGNL